MPVSRYKFNSVSFSLLGTRAGHLQVARGDPEGFEDPGPTTHQQENLQPEAALGSGRKEAGWIGIELWVAFIIYEMRPFKQKINYLDLRKGLRYCNWQIFKYLFCQKQEWMSLSEMKIVTENKNTTFLCVSKYSMCFRF